MHCSLDYAVPFTLKFNKGQGTKTTKALFVHYILYLCVWIQRHL